MLASPHDVVLVLTRPDQAAGRGMRATASAVKRLAIEHHRLVFQPLSLKTPEVESRFREAAADVLVVAAYGLIVPGPLLALPRLGAVNVHASLLPRWRGAAPIQRALLAGDRRTGISIMKMDEGLDTGPIYEMREVQISDTDDAGSLHDKLAALGGDALLEVLASLQEGRARAVAQAAQGATYAAKIATSETLLDWQRPAAELERAVRAFRPAPGARLRLQGGLLKVWKAAVVDAQGPPGMVLDAPSPTVACGRDALRLIEVQGAGGRRMSAAEFARGHPLPAGTRLR